MQLPAFIENLPALDIPFPESKVSARALRCDDGLAVFFTFHEDTDLPEHAHGPQWGTVVRGAVTITMNGATRTYRPGDSYDIPGGTPHAVSVAAGTIAIDVFAEPDRYPLRPR